MKTTHGVILFSGGLDSTVLTYYLRSQGDLLTLLSFDYGQRHSREVLNARSTANALGLSHEVIDAKGLRLGAMSSLCGCGEIPEGHYEEPSMKSTVVPGRNMVMMAVAATKAISIGASYIAIAVHAGDHHIYPDCRPTFVMAMSAAIMRSDDSHVEVKAPFLLMDKTAIVKTGAGLNVPFANTWTCYKGGETQCGACGSCVERREAFSLAGINDPTEYQSCK